MGLFSKKEKPQEVVIVEQQKKKSLSEAIFGSKKKPTQMAFSREWRATCRIRRYSSFIIRAIDDHEAEEKLYNKIKEENLPNRYYWRLEEITME